jgi:hypothetical protein
MISHVHDRQPVRLVVIQLINPARMPVFIPVKLEIGHHISREAIREFRAKLRMASLVMMKEELLQLIAVFFGSRTALPLIFIISGSTASSSTE